MEHLIHSRLSKILGIAILSTAALYGVTKSTSVNAGAYDLYPDYQRYCMADAYLLEDGNSLPQDALNCTANDVEITNVDPVNEKEECTPGQVFSFQANVTVRTNANERYDPTFYLPLNKLSPQVVQDGGKNCSLILPIPEDSGYSADVELDGDVCGDISKAAGEDEYVLENQTITMMCTDANENDRADFTYCAAWDNQLRNNCSLEQNPYTGQIPNTKSKCNCDTFDIDVYIKPTAPTITKALIPDPEDPTPSSAPEPGGEFDYSISIKNPSTTSSLFITSLIDQFDIGGDGVYSEATLDLWGPLDTVGSEDGVYLTASTCKQPPVNADGLLGEILPGATYSCTFSVQIVAKTLPPKLFNDVVSLTLEDKNGEAVNRARDENEQPIETCPNYVNGSNSEGLFCSNEVSVSITDVPPTILVTKTADPTEVLEPGGYVDFTITVKNTSGAYDSPLTLTDLDDSVFGDLLDNIDGECKDVSTSIAVGSTYTCIFKEYIEGDAGDDHDNTVVAWAKDDEGTSVKGEESAHVDINNVPSAIELTKTANPTSVPETGDDPSNYANVTYTFEFEVLDTGVDNVTFTKLEDVPFGILTDECTINKINGQDVTALALLTEPELIAEGLGYLYPIVVPIDLNGFTLEPGDKASCDITKGIQGNYGDDPHKNTATIYGIDEDDELVEDEDMATVSFDEEGPQTDVALASRLLVVLELTNPGVENVKLTALTVNALSVFDEEFNANFSLLNTGGDYGPVYYGPCVEGSDLLYNGAPSDGDKYSCAFTIELKPGLENTDPVDVTGTLAVTVTDDDGTDLTNSVSAQVITVE